jgi:ribonuclease VapC
MVIDTSALVALLLNEPDALRIVQAIEAASVRLVSAATFLETSIVIESKKGEAGGRELELLLYRASIEVAPVDQDQAEIARQAWRAGLNYGDSLPMRSRSSGTCRCCFGAMTLRRRTF